MTLPESFVQYTRNLMGDRLFSNYLSALDEPSPVSIRINPFKCSSDAFDTSVMQKVAWCPYGYYLDKRPDFTFDPLLHAGVYYVQEASSMFVCEVLRQLVHHPVYMLDLCAAPGGKSTAAMSVLPKGSSLVSNEPIKLRASVLKENVIKFGHPDITVTSSYASAFQKAGMQFDVILADVPCSGEGMFRKDPETIKEWSERKVTECAELQRSIIRDIWPCLKPGGLLIYSTCTFNAHEDEENVEWIMKEFGAKLVEIDTDTSWGIQGGLTGLEPVYRFIPGCTKGEGLFMAVLRKNASDTEYANVKGSMIVPPVHTIYSAFPPDDKKGKQLIPHVSKALSRNYGDFNFPMVEVDWQQAINYLQRMAITLSAEAPKGIVIISYHGRPLGFAKNLGSRANNLYPQEWRIKSTHLPQDAPKIITWK